MSARTRKGMAMLKADKCGQGGGRGLTTGRIVRTSFINDPLQEAHG